MEAGESQGAFDVLEQVEFGGGAADGELLQARFSPISVERSGILRLRRRVNPKLLPYLNIGMRRAEIDQRLAALTLEAGWKADRLGQRVRKRPIRRTRCSAGIPVPARRL